METLIFQSWRGDGGPPWVQRCLRSVAAWAGDHGYAYRRYGDELFDHLPAWYRERALGRPMIAADLARLLVARELLAAREAERVVWLDADVLLWAPERLELPDVSHAMGREVWIQRDERGRLRAHRKVHNALCLFRQDNPALDYLIHAATSIVGRYQGELPPTVVGPRLLGALHNLVPFPLVDSVGSLGPLVLRDVLAGGGAAWDLLTERSPAPLAGANLCASMVGAGHDGVRLSDEEMLVACAALCGTE
jgi:hypothetical protein